MKNELCRSYLAHARDDNPNFGGVSSLNLHFDRAQARRRAAGSELSDKEKRRLYMHNYYENFKERWQKGGKYYEAAKKVLNKIAKAGEAAYDLQKKVTGPNKAERKADLLGKQFRAHNEMLLDNEQRGVPGEWRIPTAKEKRGLARRNLYN